MTAAAVVTVVTAPWGASLQQRAAADVYDAECALHAARQTGVHDWIEAAATHLVAAVERSRSINRHPSNRSAA
jgi:thioredoxin-like negative regulator of GroEL